MYDWGYVPKKLKEQDVTCCLASVIQMDKIIRYIYSFQFLSYNFLLWFYITKVQIWFKTLNSFHPQEKLRPESDGVNVTSQGTCLFFLFICSFCSFFQPSLSQATIIRKIGGCYSWWSTNLLFLCSRDNKCRSNQIHK